jgi:hypothetical protein
MYPSHCRIVTKREIVRDEGAHRTMSKFLDMNRFSEETSGVGFRRVPRGRKRWDSTEEPTACHDQYQPHQCHNRYSGWHRFHDAKEIHQQFGSGDLIGTKGGVKRGYRLYGRCRGNHGCMVMPVCVIVGMVMGVGCSGATFAFTLLPYPVDSVCMVGAHPRNTKQGY